MTAGILKYEPEEARIQGDPKAAGLLKDWSPRAIAEEVDLCRDWRRQLEAVTVDNLAERLDRDILAAHLAYLEHYYGDYHGELGNLRISIYPYDVIQYELKRFETVNPELAASAARDHYYAVGAILGHLPGHLKQQQENLLAGLRLRRPDKEILQNLIETIGSPGSPGSIRGGLREIAGQLHKPKLRPLLPASERQRLLLLLREADHAYGGHADFLAGRLSRHAGDSWALGKDEYAKRFRLIYGDHISMNDLMREAEAELRKDMEEMDSLAKKMRHGPTPQQALYRLRVQQAGTGQELLRAYWETQERIDEGLTRRLGLRAGAASYHSAPSGVRVSKATNWPAPLLSPGPGIVLVNTSKLGLISNPKVDLPWIAAHEGNPGHAAQSLLFQEAFNEARARRCRFFNVPDEVGYVRGNWHAMANIEGWAFYTERLLLDSGLLTPEERLAALTGQALRKARVVADVRLHTSGWSRKDVTNYLIGKAGQNLKDAAGEAFRYSCIPLQAVSYYLGARGFRRLNSNPECHKHFGADFYSGLLSLGAVPPSMICDHFESPAGRRL